MSDNADSEQMKAETEELNRQYFGEKATHMAAHMLLLAGDKENRPEVIYSNLRELLEATLQAIELYGPGFDDAHPEGFDLMLEDLRDTIDDRLSKHDWPA
jgi:hypothetical protein